MSDDNQAQTYPRRLIIYFHAGIDAFGSLPLCHHGCDHGTGGRIGTIERDQNKRPQLLHTGFVPRDEAFLRGYLERNSPKPPRIDRLLVCLRRKINPSYKPSKPQLETEPHIDVAVAAAHTFLSRHYQPGDEVVLVASQYLPYDNASKALEILARHLQNGTKPHQPPEKRITNKDDAPAQKIPIHGVVVDVGSPSTPNISLMNDQVQARFPPQIPHMVYCSEMEDGGYWSFSTKYHSDGSSASQEVCPISI
ncbi:unnamed protein product [Rhizoctonia solani]|uniref:Uncharacterized protein n=1 Tax=Rhizoctonia solani TaxID=456999 RepID=A0A8H3A2E4_9AGAM|nr:unnamed protein product [Rhizoctonia solani]